MTLRVMWLPLPFPNRRFLFALFLVLHFLFLRCFETCIQNTAREPGLPSEIAGLDRCDLFLTYAVQAIVLG